MQAASAIAACGSIRTISGARVETSSRAGKTRLADDEAISTA